ncbi:hypothetical protein SALBM135S_07774 [Streptomyces alboniger]
MPMITVMASIAPSTRSSFFWPFWGFGSRTGIRPVSHPLPGDRRRGQAFAALAATSSSTVRSRPASVPMMICGTIRPAISAMGRPQPPLCW